MTWVRLCIDSMEILLLTVLSYQAVTRLLSNALDVCLASGFPWRAKRACRMMLLTCDQNPTTFS